MRTEPRVVVRDVASGVRAVRLRLPFRFGAVTLRACPQLYVKTVVEVDGRHTTTGMAAELMVPKWFDKRAGRSEADNVRDLAASLERAADAYRNDTPAPAFALFLRHAAVLQHAGTATGATALASAYGQAVLDRAVLDALCRALDMSVFEAVMRNVPGFADHEALADLRGFDWSRWLAALKPGRSVLARHTVGMLDELHADRSADDGLPATLPAVIRRYGNRCFKIKLGGDPAADTRRLAEVLDVLDRHVPHHRCTLDGNEQVADAAVLAELVERVMALPAVRRRPEALLYLEQPLPRERTLAQPLPPLPLPLLVDEADGTLDAFVTARTLGWQGVSSKGCKGVSKAIVNRARCDRWNDESRRDGQPPRHFMSAEDLTCQAGLAVQQDLAIASLLGLAHSERNGHHYADGFGDASAAEQHAFAAAHPDLYEESGGRARLAIREGRIAIDTLFRAGFAHSAHPQAPKGADPDWNHLQPLDAAASMV
jgi:hypothetical protein